MKFAAFAFVISVSLVAANAVPTDDENIAYDNGKCVLNLISDVVEAAEELSINIKDCTGIPNEREEIVLNAINTVIETANELTDAYEVNCKGDQAITAGCRIKMSKQTGILIGSIARAGRIIMNTSRMAGASGKCVPDEIYQTGRSFVDFPDSTRECKWWEA